MRRLLLLFLIAASALRTAAQQFIVFDTPDGRAVVDASDVESITVERDDAFYARLLPEAIASDPSTSLFGQALMRTGLADSLRAYVDESYPIMSEEERTRHFYIGAAFEWLRVPEVRRRSFTAFVETDAVSDGDTRGLEGGVGGFGSSSASTAGIVGTERRRGPSVATRSCFFSSSTGT